MQAGNQTQVSYCYDNANHLVQIIQGGNYVDLTYDAAGRRASASLPGNVAVTYTYDAASQVTGINYTAGSATAGITYTYDVTDHIASRSGYLFVSVLLLPPACRALEAGC